MPRLPTGARGPALVTTLAGLIAVAGLGLSLSCAGREVPGQPARRNPAERPPPFPTAPEFSLLDGRGVSHDLASLMGPKGLVIVLFRGHW